MGTQIIKQPDGHFALFSTSSDTIIVWDATREEVLDYFIELAVEQTRRDVTRHLDNVESGDPRLSYFQFAMSWEEAVETSRKHGFDVTDPETVRRATAEDEEGAS